MGSKTTKNYLIRDGSDIKSAGYPARQLSRIPDIRLAGYMAGYLAVRISDQISNSSNYFIKAVFII